MADLSIRYLAPARLDDGVLIETTCTQLRAASLRMNQKASREDGVLLSVAELRVGFVAPDGRPRRMPQGWAAAFAPIVI